MKKVKSNRQDYQSGSVEDGQVKFGSFFSLTLSLLIVFIYRLTVYDAGPRGQGLVNEDADGSHAVLSDRQGHLYIHSQSGEKTDEYNWQRKRNMHINQVRKLISATGRE